MISKETYETMEKEYGDVASWAVWREPGITPKSNTSDMSVFDDPNLLNILNPSVVFVGLNGSSTHGNWMGDTYRPWLNFHSGYSRQNDYKLRYALMGTKYWGSYITDIIKNHPEVDSGKVRKYLKSHPEVVAESIDSFINEISHFAQRPLIVAMGVETYPILKNLPSDFQVVEIMHYSNRIGKEEYRQNVLKVLDSVDKADYISAENNNRNTKQFEPIPGKHFRPAQILIRKNRFDVLQKGHSSTDENDPWVMTCSGDKMLIYDKKTGVCLFDCRLLDISRGDAVISEIIIDNRVGDYCKDSDEFSLLVKLVKEVL